MYDLFLSQTKILDQLGNIWIIALLVFSRSLAFVAMAPLLGNNSNPALVKISFAMIFTLIMLPNLNVPTEHPTGFKFIYLIIINIFVGLIIGWITGLILSLVKVAGEVLDSQMALNAATLFDPGSQTQSTLVGRFFDYMALALFVSIGGVEKLIEGFYKSYNTFPIIINSLSFNFDKIIKASGDIITIGVLIVSPILVILLIQDLILGLMSRAAPQINAFQISFSIKPSTGLIFLIILLPAIFQILSGLFSNPLRFY